MLDITDIPQVDLGSAGPAADLLTSQLRAALDLPGAPTVTSGMAALFGLNGGGSIVQIDGKNLFQAGNPTAVAGSKIKIERLIEDGSFKLEDEGSIWPTKTFAFAGVSKTFDSSYSSGVGSPAVAMFALANNNGADGDVVAMLMSAVARANGGTVFGGNAIARGAAGVTAKLAGFEIDVVPASDGGVLAGTGGLYINGFNKPNLGPAIQIGALGGGSFTNGIIIGGIASAGAGIAPGASATMDSLINTGSGVFGTAAIILSNQHKILIKSASGNNGAIYGDGSSNLVLQMPSGGTLAVKDDSGANKLLLSKFGIFNLNAGGAVQISGNQVVGTRQSALPSAATDLATAITLVNAIRTGLSSASGHGLFT